MSPTPHTIRRAGRYPYRLPGSTNALLEYQCLVVGVCHSMNVFWQLQNSTVGRFPASCGVPRVQDARRQLGNGLRIHSHADHGQAREEVLNSKSISQVGKRPSSSVVLHIWENTQAKNSPELKRFLTAKAFLSFN